MLHPKQHLNAQDLTYIVTTQSPDHIFVAVEEFVRSIQELLES